MGNLSVVVRHVLSNYTGFSGRATRFEFWWWILAVILIFFVTGLLDAFLIAPMLGLDNSEDPAQPLSAIVSLALFLPNLAVGVRRLHDTGRKGWWILIGLVPILGLLVLIYFYLQPSEPGENAFGPVAPQLG